MAELKTREDVEKWLKGYPREIITIFAVRAALRNLPYLYYAKINESSDFKNVASATILPVFYAVSTALLASKHPDRVMGVRAAAVVAADAATDIVKSSKVSLNGGFAAAASNAAAAAAAAHFSDSAYLASTASYAVNMTGTIFWDAVNSDKSFILAQDGSNESAALALIAKPLWDGAPPKVMQNLWTKLREGLIDLDEDWDVWTTWYENHFEAIVIDSMTELEIAKLESLENTHLQGAKIANAELRRLTDEYTVLANPKNSADKASQQVPAIYAFGAKDGKIVAAPNHVPTSEQSLAEQARASLLAQCQRAIDGLRGNMADATIVAALNALITDLENDIENFPAGSIQMNAIAIEGFADAFKNAEYSSEKIIGASLAGIARSCDHFLGYFPKLAEAEAQRLALRMQSDDAVVVEEQIITLTAIAKDSSVVDGSAVEALRKGQDIVAHINARSAHPSTSTQELAALYQERGELVSLRLLTVRNFTAATLKSAEEEKPKSFGAKMIESVQEGTLSGTKKLSEKAVIAGSVAIFGLLAVKISPQLAAIAASVKSLEIFANRAKEFEIEAEPDDRHIDT